MTDTAAQFDEGDAQRDATIEVPDHSALPPEPTPPGTRTTEQTTNVRTPAGTQPPGFGAGTTEAGDPDVGPTEGDDQP